jgi:Tol biopolymer transport system component
LHALPVGAGLFEDSQAFDVGVFARDGSLALTLGRDVGMWSAPVWSPANARGESKIAYGVALDTANTERSRYAVWIMDRDGSNKKRIFPQTNEEGLEVVRLAWSPDATRLAAIRDGDVWLYDLAHDKWSQLTANGDVQWVKWK